MFRYLFPFRWRPACKHLHPWGAANVLVEGNLSRKRDVAFLFVFAVILESISYVVVFLALLSVVLHAPGWNGKSPVVGGPLTRTPRGVHGSVLYIRIVASRSFRFDLAPKFSKP